MPNYVILTQGDQPVALIETTSVPSSVEVQLGALRKREGVAAATLEELGKVVSATCSEVVGRIREGMRTVAPDELELKFGVSISSEGGVPLIAKAGGEATIEVRAVWKHASASTTSSD